MRAIHIVDSVVVNIIEVNTIASYHPESGTIVDDNPSAEIGGLCVDGKFYPYRASNFEQSENRRRAYNSEADPIFFLIQRGESTQDDWAAKIDEIKNRLPYYYDDEGALIEAKP